ncbi:MAG: hypothetical protein LUF82_03215 [Clostridia bacterium]|nr:hypothetical protein [Clostridia bacterium]
MTLSYFFAIIFVYILIAVLAGCSRYVPQKVVRIVTIAIYAAMLVAEVVKQIVAATAEGGYDLWKAPLHFSSTFYITIGLSLLGGKRLKRIGQPVLFVSGLMLTVMILVTPKSIFGVEPSEIFTVADSTHGYFFHMAVLLELAVILARGEYVPKLYDPAVFAVFVAIYGVIAAPVAISSGLNFAGITVSYIPLLESFRQSFGQIPYLIVYYLCICALGVVVIYAFYFLRKLYKKLFYNTIKNK